MEYYGKELILDLRDCNAETFTRECIGNYFDKLCELIDMQAEDRYFWDDLGVDHEKRQTDPKTCGISAVQFILTSSIVLHSLTKLRSVYINIFSCKDFDVQKAASFTVKWFGANRHNSLTVARE